jgi:hypothetical protein
VDKVGVDRDTVTECIVVGNDASAPSKRFAAHELWHFADEARRFPDEPLLQRRQPIHHAEADITQQPQRVGLIRK